MRGDSFGCLPLLLRIFFQKPLANNFKDWYTFYDAHADFVRFRFTSADMVFCAYCHF